MQTSVNSETITSEDFQTCVEGHTPQLKIKYNIGNNQTETILVCSNCIQDPAYRDGIVSIWCSVCRCEHLPSSPNCPVLGQFGEILI